MNIPNFLSLFRIMLTPLIVIFLMDGFYGKALVTLIVSGITDALDGFLARIMKQQTVLGTYLDPIADKTLIIACFVTLSIIGIVPGWLSVIVISRDIIIVMGTSLLTMMSVPFDVRPTLDSKMTTVLQISTVILALFCRYLPGDFDYAWLTFLYWLTALFTIVSGLHYIATGIRIVNHAHP